MDATPSGGDPNDLEAHNVLAAEAFAVPAPDPAIAHDRVVLPPDPTGITRPHDVLAAEQFALPAAPPHPGGIDLRSAHRRTGPRIAVLGALAALIVTLVLRRRSRRAS
jgi:hypothetical protein